MGGEERVVTGVAVVKVKVIGVTAHCHIAIMSCACLDGTCV